MACQYPQAYVATSLGISVFYVIIKKIRNFKNMMNFFEVVLILVILGLAGVIFKFYKDNQELRKEIQAMRKEQNELEDMGKGLSEYNQKLQERKNARKKKILAMLDKKKKLSNQEVAKELSVSRDTVINYFDELEQEGKARQVGKSGRNVFYSKT